MLLVGGNLWSQLRESEATRHSRELIGASSAVERQSHQLLGEYRDSGGGVEATEIKLERLVAANSRLSDVLEASVERKQISLSSRESLTLASANVLAEWHAVLSRPMVSRYDGETRERLGVLQERLDEAVTDLLIEAHDWQEADRRHMHGWQLAWDIGLALTGLVIILRLVSPALRQGYKHGQELVRTASELKHLALVARSTTNPVMLTDNNRRIAWVNAAFTRLTGYEFDEAVGQKPAKLIQYEGTDPRTIDRIRDALERHRGIQVEIRNRAKDGREYWVSLDIQPLFSDERELTGFLSVATEITEQVELRDRLKESDDRLTTATYSAGLGLWDWYPATDEAWFDATWWRLIGYEPDELENRGSVFFGLVHPEDAETVRSSIEKHVRGVEPEYRAEFRMRTKAGSWKWIRAIGRVSQRAADGSPSRFSGVHLDIHAQRLALEATRASETRLQVLAANVPGMILQLRLSPDGQLSVPFANASIEPFFGITAEEVSGDAAPLLQRMEPDDALGLLDRLRDAASTQSLLQDCVRVIDGEGRLRWLEISGQPELEWDGGVLFHGYVQDITERKLTESALRESEHRFRDLADSVPVLVWLSGIDGKCTDFNAEWLAFTGRSLDDELGDGWTDGVHPEDLENCVQTYYDAFERREAFEMEYRLRRHDGLYRWILDRGHPRLDADGSFQGYIGGCLDVTDRRNAEAELERRETELRNVLVNSPGVAYRRANDPSEQVLFVSDRIQEWTGLSKEAFLCGGLGIIEIVDERDRETVRQSIEQALAERRQWSVEYRVTDAKGAQRWILEQGSATFSDTGEKSMVDGFLVDVTPLKQATSEAARWRETATLIIESALDAVICLDAEGAIIQWNQRATSLFGFTQQEAREVGFENLVDVSCLGPERPLCSPDSLGTRFETRAAERMGAELQVEVAITPTTIDSVTQYSVFIRDISTSHQSRLELEHARCEAEAANRAKTDFLANMSHEIRTPMTAILGYADLLQEDRTFDQDPTRRVQAVDSIRRNGRHLLSVINDILDVSKIEAGKLQLDIEPVMPHQACL
ncbi:MAG: PAS domain S-box protein [Pirellulaceae bacterium]